MTLEELYHIGSMKLQEASVPEADLDAWYLLEFVTGVSRALYFAKLHSTVSEEEEKRYLEYIEKRAERIPLQHITGVQEFMGFEFEVNEHVLIPRQDTENLVEYALSYLSEDMRVLDMCTGSGCILLSLLKMKHCRGTGVDISEKALETAVRNAERLSVDAEFIKSDLFENVEGKYDMIVSNPPYIPTEVIRTLEEEVKCFDPMLALDGMEDGLFFYRKIVAESVDYLVPGGRLLFEIGHDQAESVTELMKKAGFCQIEVKKDLAGLDRVVLGVYNIIEGLSTLS